MKKYDAIIIGFGKGGKTLAAEFAKRQKTVAIVERSDRMYGGAVQPYTGNCSVDVHYWSGTGVWYQ